MKIRHIPNHLKIRGIFLILVSLTFVSCKNDNITGPEISQMLTAKVKKDLSEITERVFQATGTPGIIAQISVEGEPDLIIKRGVANLVTNEPMNELNAFRIGSVTKTFTGTAVLLLAEEGLINLDSSIAYYLPEKNIPSGNQITVRMLGTMTSGLYNYSDAPELWTPFISSGYVLEFPPDSLLAISFSHPMTFAPGAGYEYSNTNTVLLGLLIEKVTGKPAFQVIKERITDPLQLNDTYWGGLYFRSTPYTNGYAFEDEGVLNATNWNPSWGYTAGAMISDLADMKRWAYHLAEGTLLKESSKTVMFNTGTNNYGFCVESVKFRNDLWIGHPGSIPGYNTMVFYNKAKKMTVLISSNTDNKGPANNLLIEFIIYLGNL